MNGSRLTVVRYGTARPEASPGETVVSTEDLKQWLRSGQIVRRLFSWSEARLLTDRLATLGRPLPAALTMRLLTRGRCYAADATGDRRELSIRQLSRWMSRAAVEPFQRGSLMQRVADEVTCLEQSLGPEVPAADFSRARPPVYVRSDLAFGLKAGGSIGHTAGVINHLGDFVAPPIVLSTDRVPTVRPDVEFHDVVADEAFWQYRELPAMVMNASVRRTAAKVLANRPIGFVYQRYTPFGYAAVELASQHRVPLVTEYNGSEVWIARHWGRPFVNEALATRIERLNLRAAHLVSVVSRPLANEVEACGVDPARVLVNPNGVDAERYHPGIDARDLRARLGMSSQTVIGFIGTFGPWHGAEVLAEAFARMLSAHPEWRTRVRLLFIGDGVGLPRVREMIAQGGVSDACVFTGLVPQAQGPEYLAACDVLASPHVPNADGSPFFGSPTKLFEYMALGRGIVASRLDQIGEVLEDGRTALLVPPGDAAALAAALARLVADQTFRSMLGIRAREEVVAHYTWRRHVERLIDRLAVLTADTPRVARDASASS